MFTPCAYWFANFQKQCSWNIFQGNIVNSEVTREIRVTIFGTYPLYSVFLKNSGYGTIILQTHRIQVSVKAIRNKKFESSHSLPQNSWVKKLLSMSQQSINNLSLPEIKGTTCGPTETRNKDLTKKRKYTNHSLL